MTGIDRTILHVDDDPDLLRIVGETLKHHGYRVSSVSDPQDALRIQRQRNVRLVLLDVDMPQIDGLDLLRQMKEHDGGVQAIVLTGLATTSTVMRAIRYGAETCIFKPITNCDRLLTAVARAFEKIERWWEILNELEERRTRATESVRAAAAR